MERICKTFIFLSIMGLALSCHKDEPIDYRQEMRNFVVAISKKAKAQKENFAIITQNGVELICNTNNSDGQLASEYISAIDGQGQEDLFFGYTSDNKPTPRSTTDYLKSYLSRLRNSGKTIFTTDYCSSVENIALSQRQNQSAGFISFQATSRNLDIIPSNLLQNENHDTITNLEQAKNFLYLINPENFETKQDFINAVCTTNYDLIIMDLFLGDDKFSDSDIERLREKANGGRRMVIAYMSIGEAEKYRYYWNSSWKRGNPSWLDKENPQWKGNYKVKYWNKEWQAIIFDYLTLIITADFDGVYLDIIDAFEYYE